MPEPELIKWEIFAKEILRRCFAEEDPEELRAWMLNAIQRIDKPEDALTFLEWLDSFDYTDAMLDNRALLAALPESERKTLTWPWSSWSARIDPLAPGMLGVVTAPDGMGKTIYAEMLAEHWAQRGNRVLFVHFELNHSVMMTRRLARQTGYAAREITAGRYTPIMRAEFAEAHARMRAWAGGITYMHSPGWTMERTTAEMSRLRAEGKCDVVVLDYLEKVAASKNQLKLFGSNQFQREADNVEQLKTFAEQAGVPILMVAQMNKTGKSTGFATVDRTAMRGAGEKSEKANLVVLLSRERTADGYSNEIDVLIDKNTMGATGAFRQYMQPEYFRVRDLA